LFVFELDVHFLFVGMSKRFFNSKQIWRKVQKHHSSKDLRSLDEHSNDCDTNSNSLDSNSSASSLSTLADECPSAPVRTVSFADTVDVYLYPPATECIKDFCGFNGRKQYHDLYWQTKDFKKFKEDALSQIEAYWHLLNSTEASAFSGEIEKLTPKDIAFILYQPNEYDEQIDTIYDILSLAIPTGVHSMDDYSLQFDPDAEMND
jgi:hypothetical protein